MKDENKSQFSYNLEQDVLDTFRSYRSKSAIFDVTICCTTAVNSNQVVYTQAHKMILSAASPVIKAILENSSKMDDNSCSFIYLAGISQQSLFFLLNYIYNGEVQVPGEYIEAFIASAKQLQIKLVEGQSVSDINNNPDDVSKEEKFPLALDDGDTPSMANGVIPEQLNQCLNEQVRETIQPKIEANSIAASILPEMAAPVATIKKEKIKAPKKPKEGVQKEAMKTPKAAKPKPSVPKAKSNQENSKPLANNAGTPKKEAGPVDPAAAAASTAIWKEWKEMHTSSDDKGFHCLKCPETKSFTMSSNLGRHYKQAHEQICKFCKFPYISEEILLQHIQEKHEYKCPGCDKTFTMKSNLGRHQKKGCTGNGGAEKLMPSAHLSADTPMEQQSSTNIDTNVPTNIDLLKASNNQIKNETPESPPMTSIAKVEPEDFAMKEEGPN